MAAQEASQNQFNFSVSQNSIFTGGASAASFGNPWKPSTFAWSFSGLKPNMTTDHSSGVASKTVEDAEFERHLSLFDIHDRKDGAGSVSNADSNGSLLDEMKTAPLFSAEVKKYVAKETLFKFTRENTSTFPQHGLIGLRLETHGDNDESETKPEPEKQINNLMYANITAPWSTFICGSQGSGKSHTLSCMLENMLLTPSKTGTLHRPLAGIIFHYDKFTNFSTTQLCEAAYLCSHGVPVRVLVSPSNFMTMQKLYRNLPGLPAHAPKPKVVPMYFREEYLNITMMKTLMAIGGEGNTPLYIEVLSQVLRGMAMESQGSRGLNYKLFKQRLESERFSKDQLAPLRLRLQLLESFLDTSPKSSSKTADIWEFEKGTLTIVDLSCPFVDENDACALFNICLSLFLENRGTSGRLIALDEAHKFLSTKSNEALEFTDTLLSVIRQQRHLGTRVVIATQEPTLSPDLLDLCNVTIVHRFSSPAWYKMLEAHLAAALIGKQRQQRTTVDSGNLFDQIVKLKTGEALLFCPTAAVDVATDDTGEINGNRSASEVDMTGDIPSIAQPPSPVSGRSEKRVKELGSRYIRMKIRNRITADGGRSILAE
ncbi:hypothetical protein DTO166G4_792 [Paecilomyces variotii]|nr:hypothetical protein DTO166G4_792 [Paecilomyces variotii]KAJ9242900.1 hypothetical protein DTO166G5_4 [Paecilomyces variotii]KAJ9361759.1 hypothetical protein DTO280E4_3592 [Paecilomyces variotii]KAJ9390964.1 hypothetical protein DTO063F5_1408 [Paecilomyces variotii]